MDTKSVSLGKSRMRRKSKEEPRHAWDASVLSDCNAMSTVHSLLVLKGWQESKCPSTSEWITAVHPHCGPTTPQKETFLVHAATWMNLTGITLSGRSQTQKSPRCVSSCS